MNPKNKHTIRSAHAHTPVEWVKIITDSITEPYLQGWAASIIAWDLSDDKDPEARKARALDGLIEQCELDQAFKFYTSDLQAALEQIGYGQAECRCTVKYHVPEGDNKNLKGAYTVMDRTWSADVSQRKASHGFAEACAFSGGNPVKQNHA